MIRIVLSAEQREAVGVLRRDATLRPAERDRVEMLLLSAAGWAAPRIAQHLECSTATVRRFFHAFQSAGLAAIRRRRPGPPPHRARRQQVEAALRGLLRRERTWSARQLAVALREQRVDLSARQVHRYLHGLRARYRRTARTLRHKRNPAAVAAAQERLDHRKKVPRLAS